MKSKFILVLSVLIFCLPLTAFAAVAVDNSPDTTGVPVVTPNFSNEFGVEYLGDRFTLANNTTITGGAIFSHIFFGAVGDSVRFVILPDAGGVPGAVPVLDVVTTLDAVDNTLATSDDFMNRKHATIPPQLLPAGNYWFYMSGNGVQITQGTGAYDDNSFYRGYDGNPDLEVGTDNGRGDVFFTLEGDTAQTGVTENDGCDVGGGGNDVDTVVADSDGTSIFVHLNLCDPIDDKVKYRVHFDYTDQFDGFGNNDPDTPTNAGCVTTSDDTMMLRGSRETGPGEITTDTDMIWYEVDYDELAKNGVILGSGDQVLIWADSQYKGINDRAPNTQEPCSKPQVIGEVMDLTLLEPPPLGDCPCWDEEDLLSVTEENQNILNSCDTESNFPDQAKIQNNEGSTPGVEGGFAAILGEPSDCATRDFGSEPGSITAEEAAACIAQIAARCAAIGSPLTPP